MVGGGGGEGGGGGGRRGRRWSSAGAHLHAVVEMPSHHHLVVCPFGLAGLDQRPRSQLLIEAYLKAEL